MITLEDWFTDFKQAVAYMRWLKKQGIARKHYRDGNNWFVIADCETYEQHQLIQRYERK